ncbi:MAG: hypothetical protein KDA29_03340 [Phycisphaerales bacterium]|nr:hypothetical protein [Phycisphaerales bacterium]
MRRTMRCVGAMTLLVAMSAGALGQDGQRPPIIPTPQGSGQAPGGRVTGSLPDLFARINDMDPLLRPGLRASLLRQAQMVVPFVVIVDDAPSYLYAISQWELMIRFPVLWDDGRVESRENIARFIRGFKPERVYRLEDDGDWDFEKEFDARSEQIDKALGKALSEQIEDWRDSMREVHSQGIVSPGVVLTDPTDAAWAGALALSAGRLQPIGYMIKPANLPPPLEPDAADRIERELERLAGGFDRSWDKLGDDIDAVTLAMNTGTRIQTGAGARDMLATSDRLGRTEHNGAGTRWAYCGQLIGSESQSVYRAMCALFLEIDQAFIWDGYGNNEPWAAYDGTEAAAQLEPKDIRVELHDQPKYTIEHWRNRMVRSIGERTDNETDALLMLMNSKGANRRFDLPGSYAEEGRAGDIPMLQVPAAMHIVHSFSLQLPFRRITIGARLLERGVYVYAGSVDEPFLNGFVPTPDIAKRLAAGLAFGTAVRFDNGQVWKIAVLGDPLVTLGSAGRRTDAELTIDSLVNLDERVKQRLSDEDFAGAIEDLVLLGRDEDASRLAMALMKDKPEAFKPQAALLAMGALQRTGDFTAMVDCYEHMDNAGRADGIMQDYLWLASPYLLARGEQDPSLRARIEALLRANIREGQEISDAERLAMSMRSHSLDAALGVLEGIRYELSEADRTMLDRAIERVKR